jgi:uncharacterized membrane protein
MKSYRIAVFGFFLLVIGIVLFLNASAFIPSTYCAPPLSGSVLYTSMAYETITGFLLLGGAAIFFGNATSKDSKLGKTTIGIFTCLVLLAFLLIIFLIAFHSVGVFGGPRCYTVCVAGSGFYCSSLIYSHTGNITMTIGQSTGTNWGNALILFAIQGNTISANGPIVPATQQSAPGGLLSGQAVGAAFTDVEGNYVPIGSTLAGMVWACYITGNSAVLTDTAGNCTAAPAGQTIYYTQMATVSARAT